MPGPQFVTYLQPVLDALRQLGNSGTPAEVRAAVAKNLNLGDDVLNDTMPSGSSRFINRVNWARFYLAKAGLIDASKRGVWNLTEKGLTTSLTAAQALQLFNEVHKEFGGKANGNGATEVVVEEESVGPPEQVSAATDYRSQLLETLRALPPAGFERLCQRLLRESDFQEVEVTGRSGDGGIDGRGILQVNRLLSFQVIFQCKRYAGSVGSPDIRNFRGAMMGRADKGIFLTTGTFTAEARREAVRDGVPPIELVDADKLITMFEGLELGPTPIKTFQVDARFFDEFR